MFKTILSFIRGKPPVPIDEEETPRYPPFMKGLPASSVEKLLETQSELIARLRQAVGVTDELFNTIYMPLIERYIAYVHLLPASEGHHHRGAGGLLRHGLEVALWATQGADRVMFAMGEPPARRRELEPRWRCGVFIAALAHDVGKPLSDVQVVDDTGKHEWGGHGEDLAAWLKRVGTRRYFLRWRTRRHQRHESLTPMVLPHLIPQATLDYLQAAGPELYEQILFAINARDFQANDQEHNPIFKLVREADQASTRKDISDPVAAGVPGALGVPLERYVMDAIRRLVRERRWIANKPGARLWVIEGDLFIVWPSGADDIVSMLARDKAPGIPRHPDSLADVLIDRGLAIPFEEAGARAQVWPIQPDVLRERNPVVILYALRLNTNARIFDEPPPSINGALGIALLEFIKAPKNAVQDAVATANTTAQPTANPSISNNHVTHIADEAAAVDGRPPAALTKENPKGSQASSGANGAQEAGHPASSPVASAQEQSAPVSDAPNTQASQTDQAKNPTPSKSDGKTIQAGQDKRQAQSPAKEASNEQKLASPNPNPPSVPAKHNRPRKTVPSQLDTEAGAPSQDSEAEAEAAQAWLARNGHAGAVIAAIAEDFRDGAKQWGKHGVRVRDGAIAIAHPEGWGGSGVANKDVLVLLAEAGWVALDPFEPMKRVREIDGFAGSKGASRRPTIVLTEAPSKHFTAIAGEPTQSAAPRPSTAPTRATNPQPAGKAPDTGRGGKRPASNPATGMPEGEALVAAIREIVSPEGMGLPHRRSNGAIYIAYGEAAGALASHLGVSMSRARTSLFALPMSEDGSEIVVPAENSK